MRTYLQSSFIISLTFLFFLSCSSDSEEPTPEPDVIAPTVDFAIAGSSAGTGTVVVSNQMEINITAQDAGGIAKVEAFINDQKVGEDTTAPFNIVIDVSGYASKVAQTTKFKDYVLKIVVTDTSGNISSKEQTINIDNELPVISEVSLQAGTVINGESNPVTFNVTDNEGLLAVKAYLNNELYAEVPQDNFEISINTLDLTDGENTLKIEAIDLAKNTVAFEVGFIVDNTGPEIQLSSVAEGQILDEKFLFNPVLQDEHSEIVSFTAKLNGNTILESSTAIAGEVDINPEDLPVGDVIFELTATDNLDNTTTLVINSEVLRRLFAVKMDEGFLVNTWLSFWILVSDMAGNPITHIPAQLGDSEIIVHAPGEFSVDNEYMVSFIADENHGSWTKTHMSVIQNLTRSNFEQIHFTPSFGDGYWDRDIAMSGFDESDEVGAQGRNFQLYSNDQNLNLKITRNEGFDQYFPENAYLIGTDLFPDVPYSYLKIENPWNTDLVIAKSDFISENVETGFADLSLNNLPYINPRLLIYGYESTEDFNNNVFHTLFKYENKPVQFGGGVQYHFPDIFDSYKHHLRLNNYNTIRNGKPLNQYFIPDWSTDYLQNGNEIALTNTGNGYVVGRLTLTYGKESGGYQSFVMIYDPSKTEKVFVPKLPEVMSNLTIYEAFQNQSFEVDYSDLSSFDNIDSYNGYLNTVISPYKEHYGVSSIIEVILEENSNLGGILSNWSFKYN